MLISENIVQLTSSPEVAFWASNLGPQGFCDLSRISGIKIEKDGKHLTFYIPKSFFPLIASNLKDRPKISLLLASLRNFESYQIKGEYLSHEECEKEDIAYYQPMVSGLIDISNSMGLNGNKIFDSFLEEPNIAVKVLCKEIFEQTPKPGTGNKL